MANDLASALKVLNGDRVKKGDPPESACRSERMNAITDAIIGLARGDNIGRGVGLRKRTSDGGFILSSDVKSEPGAGGSFSGHPFQVYESYDNTEPPYPILKVYFGTVAGIVPTLANAKLDVPDTESGLHPWFYPPGTPFTFYLRCKVDLVGGDIFRPTISEVKVLTDDDAAVIADLETDGSLKTLQMFWDDLDEITGHFYIQIADVEMKTDEGNIVFVGATQWLRQNVNTFMVADAEVIIIT